MTVWPMVNAGSTGLTSDRFMSLSGGLGSANSQSTTEADMGTLVRGNYTLSNLWVRIPTNTRNATTTGRTRVNAGNGAQSVSVNASTTGVFEDTVNSDSLVDGDLANYQYDIAGTSGTVTVTAMSVLCSSATDQPVLTTTNVGRGFVQNTTRYAGIGGTISNGTTSDAGAQYTIREAETFDKLRAYLPTNTASVTTTIRTRVNAGNGGQTLSILTTATGSFEDTTGTDVLASGDEFNFQVVVPAGSGTATVSVIQVRGNRPWRQLGAGWDTLFAPALTRFQAIEEATAEASTESDVQIDIRTSGLARDFFVNVASNGADNTSAIDLRVDGGTSALGVSVASTLTGFFEDTSSEVTLAGTEMLNYQIDTTASGSGNLVTAIIGMEFGPLPVAGGSGRKPFALLGVGL